MNALKELTYLDALLLMCLHYKDIANDSESSVDDVNAALGCIRDCERRQMELSCG